MYVFERTLEPLDRVRFYIIRQAEAAKRVPFSDEYRKGYKAATDMALSYIKDEQDREEREKRSAEDQRNRKRVIISLSLSITALVLNIMYYILWMVK